MRIKFGGLVFIYYVWFLAIRPLEDGDELELKAYLELTYVTASQYDDPPTYPVKQFCNSIDAAAARGNNIIDQIASAVNVTRRRKNNNDQCLDLTSELRPSDDPLDGWNWLWQVIHMYLNF